MSKIHQLDSDTANKIAAGEVIERPANVVKELVENSIDAKATKIDVEAIEGGSVLMRVSDNGTGMDEEDAQMCFGRHATSKIMDDHDLFNITTLGFRGEAIPSIASISQFTLETCTQDQGTRVVYEFGKKKAVETCALNKGTRITVEKIFQNVPARLKYMKSVNTEFAAIYTYIERLSLAHPEIAFSLKHNDRMIYTTNGSGKLLEVIAAIYGIETAKDMIPVDFGNEEFKITGYTSNRRLSRASKNHIITLVNHRYVRNQKSINAINEVYRGILPERRFPITVINIEVDPYLVDVNVHPAKLEVRFSKEALLKEMITEGFSDALKPKVEPEIEPVKKETVNEKVEMQRGNVQMHFKLDEDVPQLVKPVKPKPMIVKEETPVYHEEKEQSEVKEETVKAEEPIKAEEPVRLKPIKEKIYIKGQLRGSYLMGENERGIFLIDQKRAMERIAYDKYKTQLAQSQMVMTKLIVPLTFELPESEYLLLEDKKDDLMAFGINLEPISRNTYCVREVPLFLRDIDEQAFIEDLIQKLISDHDVDLLELRDYALISLSLKAAVNRNTHLSMIEMQSLADDLMRCDEPYNDASGHTIIVFYSDYELNKLFRKGVR